MACVPCLLADPTQLESKIRITKIVSDVQRCRISPQRKSNTVGSVASSTTLHRMIFELSPRTDFIIPQQSLCIANGIRFVDATVEFSIHCNDQHIFSSNNNDSNMDWTEGSWKVVFGCSTTREHHPCDMNTCFCVSCVVQDSGVLHSMRIVERSFLCLILMVENRVRTTT